MKEYLTRTTYLDFAVLIIEYSISTASLITSICSNTNLQVPAPASPASFLSLSTSPKPNLHIARTTPLIGPQASVYCKPHFVEPSISAFSH